MKIIETFDFSRGGQVWGTSPPLEKQCFSRGGGMRHLTHPEKAMLFQGGSCLRTLPTLKEQCRWPSRHISRDVQYRAHGCACMYAHQLACMCTRARTCARISMHTHPTRRPSHIFRNRHPSCPVSCTCRTRSCFSRGRGWGTHPLEKAMLFQGGDGDGAPSPPQKNSKINGISLKNQ